MQVCSMIPTMPTTDDSESVKDKLYRGRGLQLKNDSHRIHCQWLVCQILLRDSSCHVAARPT